MFLIRGPKPQPLVGPIGSKGLKIGHKSYNAILILLRFLFKIFIKIFLRFFRRSPIGFSVVFEILGRDFLKIF